MNIFAHDAVMQSKAPTLKHIYNLPLHIHSPYTLKQLHTCESCEQMHNTCHVQPTHAIMSVICMCICIVMLYVKSYMYVMYDMLHIFHYMVLTSLLFFPNQNITIQWTMNKIHHHIADADL